MKKMIAEVEKLDQVTAEGAWRICGSVGACRPYPRIDPNDLYYHLIKGIQVDEWNRETIKALAAYFSGDVAAMEKMGLDAGKNLFLHGPPGSGKSSLIDKIWRLRHFVRLQSKELAGMVMDAGYAPLLRYGKGKGYRGEMPPELLVEDVGWEPTVNYKGTVIEVLDELICYRDIAYDRFGTRTIFVSNNPPDQIGLDYGDRAGSRLNHFNIVGFPEGGPDRRKAKKIELIS